MDLHEINLAIKRSTHLQLIGMNGLNGIRCVPTRFTSSKNFVFVTLIEDGLPDQPRGTAVRVRPFNLEPKVERQSELQANYEQATANVLRSLLEYVDRYNVARVRLIEKMKDPDTFEPLVQMMRWGEGVKIEILASLAKETIRVNSLLGTERGLRRMLDWLDEQAKRAGSELNSTNAFSNAVELDRLSAHREFRDQIRVHLDWVATARAKLEVL